MEKSCIRCGWCCTKKVVEVPHKILTISDQDYYKYHGIIIERKDRNTDRQIIPCRCIHLTKDNLCDIWETRPDMCDKTRRGNHKIYSPPWCQGE